MHHSIRLVIALACVLAAAPTHAVDMADLAPAVQSTPDRLAGARMHLQARRFGDAIAELKRVNDGKNADWNNLMGYAHRKLAPPDLAAAERYYDAALAIDAQHRGALEYSGELYLMKGDLSRAEQRLTQLARACGAPCDEHADLKQAVARFKANGNAYKPAP